MSKNRGKSNTQRENVFGNIRSELRKTHFHLGNDRSNFESQYKKDYTQLKGANAFGPNMDSVTLRKSHFILGDYRNNYQTTNNEQNRHVDPKGRPVASLNDELKADLRKSHFILGNHKANMIPSSKSDYINRDLGAQAKGLAYLGKALRKHSHVLGDTHIEYKSEMQAKFNNPNTTGKQQQIVSTAELQKSHYVFGSTNDPWSTTAQSSFGPKEVIDSKLYSKNLTKTNFILGDDRMPMKSVSHQTFIPHKNLGYSQKNKELSADLRQHHFKFGNDAPSMSSISQQDYTERDFNNARFKQTLDGETLKKSHFSIGDKSQAAKDHFETTYQKAMNNKGIVADRKLQNATFKSSINIKGKDNDSYVTESQAK